MFASANCSAIHGNHSLPWECINATCADSLPKHEAPEIYSCRVTA
jgi:hypothetical protein